MDPPATHCGDCPTGWYAELIEQADAETLRLVAYTWLLAAGSGRARRDLLLTVLFGEQLDLAGDARDGIIRRRRAAGIQIPAPFLG